MKDESKWGFSLTLPLRQSGLPFMLPQALGLSSHIGLVSASIPQDLQFAKLWPRTRNSLATRFDEVFPDNPRVQENITERTPWGYKHSSVAHLTGITDYLSTG